MFATFTAISMLITFFILLISSFAIYLIAAGISKWKKNRMIWVYSSYVIYASLLIYILIYWLDDIHYVGTIKDVSIIISLSAIALIIPILIHANKIRQWNMWLYSFVLPIFISSIGMYIEGNACLVSKEVLEGMIGIELPQYRVIEFEEYSPGGDDWEVKCTIRLKKNGNLEDFYKTIEEKCLNGEGEYTDFDCYSSWSIVNGEYQFYDRADIEHWLTVRINKETNMIYYHDVYI